MDYKSNTTNKFDLLINQPNFLFLIFILVSGIYLFHSNKFNFFIMDDAAISYSYANNILSGLGARLCPGNEIVEGYSNPLWVLIIGLLIKFHLFHPVYTLKIFGIILSISTVSLCVRWLREIFESPKYNLCYYLFFPLILYLHTPFVVWNVSGLENPLYNFLIILSFYLFSLEIKNPQDERYSSALCFFLISITRPEGAIYFFIALFTRCFLERKKIFSLRFLFWVLLFFVPFILYHIIHYLYFQNIFPNTYYAKTENATAIFRLLNIDKRGWNYVISYFKDTHYFIFLPLILICFYGALRRSIKDFLPFLLLFFVIPLYVVWVIGDWMFQYRFLVHYSIILAFLFISSCIIFSEWLTKKFSRISPVALSHIICLIGVIIIGTRAFIETPKAVKNPSTPMSVVKSKAQIYNNILSKAMIQNPLVVDVDVGGTSYFGKFDIVDLGKLADVHISKYHWANYFGDYIFRERKPTIIHSQGYYTKMAHWERFPEIKSDYIDINKLFFSNEFNCIKRDTFSNPDSSPTLELNKKITDDLYLKGISIHTPYLFSTHFKPFFTIYWQTSKGKITDSVKMKFVLNNHDMSNDWFYPLHQLISLSELNKDSVYFEHHRISLPQPIPPSFTIDLKIKINNRDEIKIPIGYFEVSEACFVEYLSNLIFAAKVALISNNYTIFKNYIWKIDEIYEQSIELCDNDLCEQLIEYQNVLADSAVTYLNSFIIKKDYEGVFKAWMAIKNWKYHNCYLLSEFSHKLAKYFFIFANEQYHNGDIFSLTKAFINYWKSIQIAPNFPLARKRMEEIRPLFSAINNIFDKKLYAMNIEQINITPDIERKIILSLWLINEYKPITQYLEIMLHKNKEIELFDDPIMLSCFSSSAKITKRYDLVEKIINNIGKDKIQLAANQFKPLQFLINKNLPVSSVQNNTIGTNVISATIKEPANFGAFKIKDVTFIPQIEPKNSCLVLVTIQRSGTIILPYSIRMTAIPKDKELLKQQDLNLPFLFWGLKPKLAFKKLPKNRDVTIPFLINILDGEYDFKMVFEFYTKGKSYFLHLKNYPQQSFSFNIKIDGKEKDR